MRRTLITTLVVALMAGAACKGSTDPNKFETYLEDLKDSSKRGPAFNGLERLTKGIVTSSNRDERVEEFATKVIPVFEEIWAEAPEQHEMMLTLLRDVGHPAGAPIWNMALPLDGSLEARKETILALEGIKKAKAQASVDAILAELGKLIEKPINDSGDKEAGEVRALMAETLGEVGDKKAVPILIQLLEQAPDTQPVLVHRAAADAAGQIGDPAAIDALLSVTFRVPDAPTTTNIAERAKLALVGIGEPAIPKVVEMLRGQNEEVQKLAAEVARRTGGEQQIGQLIIQQTAAAVLGAMGDPKAVDDLLAVMPSEDCTAKPKKAAKKDDADDEEPAVDSGTLRGVIASSLGFIGDPKAAGALCMCVNATHNPGDMFPIIEALGRVGGDKALSCLLDVVENGRYDEEVVEKPFVYQPRWEAGRFAVLVAKPDDVAKVRRSFASNAKNKRVADELQPWETGVQLLESCKADKDCYLKTLADVNADWFAREKAAYEVERLAGSDKQAAITVADAFKVRSPDARVSMALIPARMLRGQSCPECVDAYDRVLKSEKLSMDATYQLSVLTVRSTMAKLGRGPAPAPTAKPAEGDAKAGSDAKAGGDAKAEGKAGGKAGGQAGGQAGGKAGGKAGGDAKAEGKAEGDAKAEAKAKAPDSAPADGG